MKGDQTMAVHLKLSPNDVAILRLFLRSTNEGDGWGHVSPAIMRQIIPRLSQPDLIEVERNEDGSGRARLTARAVTLTEFFA